MINPTTSLPGYGAILKHYFKLDTEDDDRTVGDLCAAALDSLVGMAWSFLGMFPEEAKKHRDRLSILEIQEFLDWAMAHLIRDMGWDAEAIKEEINRASNAFLEKG